MQAIIQDTYDGIEGLKVKEISDPKVSPLSALIETKFTPVLPYDWRTENGELKSIRPVKLPIVIGYGFGGIIKDVGSLRSNNLIGQKVIGATMSGSNSTFVDSRIPPLLFKVPESVDLSAATTIIGGADTALGIINKLNINNPDKVLITGASVGIGTYLIQLLKLRNVQVVAIGHTENMDFLKNVGADVSIDYTTNISELLLQNKDITKVIDTAGSVELLNVISRMLSNAKIVSIATNLIGQFIQPNIFPKDYEKLLDMLKNKELHSYIQNIYDYKDVRLAQTTAKNNHSKGRTLLKY